MNQAIQTKAGEIKIIDSWVVRRQRKCKAICFCGKTWEVFSQALKKGRTSSCGCYKKKFMSETGYKHGHTNWNTKLKRSKHSKTYNSWYTMKSVCYNKNHLAYKNTGALGIKVCDEWKDDFRNFLRDMGEKPEDTMFCRTDKDGDFEPDNCEWVPMKSRLSGKRYT